MMQNGSLTAPSLFRADDQTRTAVDACKTKKSFVRHNPVVTFNILGAVALQHSIRLLLFNDMCSMYIQNQRQAFTLGGASKAKCKAHHKGTSIKS